MRFEDYAKQFIVGALERLPAEDLADVYAVSLLVYDEDDDPRRATVTVGYNTERQVIEAQKPPPKSDDDRPVHERLITGDLRAEDALEFDLDPAIFEGLGTPPDPAEARWNFAFWQQYELGVLGDGAREPEGAALRERWIRDGGLWYDGDTDEMSDEEFDAAEELDEQITERFIEQIVSIAGQLHDEGAVERIFGRAIPVLIHELEYDDEIAEQNQRANPDGLADDFARWISDMSNET